MEKVLVIDDDRELNALMIGSRLMQDMTTVVIKGMALFDVMTHRPVVIGFRTQAEIEAYVEESHDLVFSPSATLGAPR